MNKTIHTIWLDQNVPERVHWMTERWRRLNPDWHVLLHTDDGLLHEDYRPHYAVAKYPSIRADLLRLSILERYGGVYADLDAVPIVPLDQWLRPQDGLLTACLPLGVLDSWFLACQEDCLVMREMRALACWLGDIAGSRAKPTLYAGQLLERAQRWRPDMLPTLPWQWFTTGRRSNDRQIIRDAIAGKTVETAAKMLHYYAANQIELK